MMTFLNKSIFSLVLFLGAASVHAAETKTLPQEFQIAEGTQCVTSTVNHLDWPSLAIEDYTGGKFSVKARDDFKARHQEVNSSWLPMYNGKGLSNRGGGTFGLCNSLKLTLTPTKDGIALTEVDDQGTNTFLIRPDYSVKAIQALEIHFWTDESKAVCVDDSRAKGSKMDIELTDPKNTSHCKQAPLV